MNGYVAAIDQGTTSTRCLLIGHDGRPVASHQLEHTSICRVPDGSSTTRTRSGPTRARSWRAVLAWRRSAPPTWSPSASPTSGRRPSSGSGREAGPSGHRLAGHPDPADLRPAGRERRHRPVPPHDRTPTRHLLRRSQGGVDPRRGRRRPDRRGQRRPAVRHDGHLPALAGHRRPGRRCPRHRRHERVADDAHGPAHAGLGRGDLRRDGRTDADASRNPLVRGGLRACS